MRTIEEIKKEIIELIKQNPKIRESEISKQLKLSTKITGKILDDMLEKGEICQNF